MKKFAKTLGAFLTGMALVFGMVSCKPEIQLQTVETKVYTCPSCGTEYETATEAQNCCGVKYVTKYSCPECGKKYSTPAAAAECYASHQPALDETAPEDVTSLAAANLDNAVALTWTDPEDEDLFGIEITWTPQTVNKSRAVATMEADSLFVAPGKQIAEISNLKNGVEYTFTVKAMDTSGNKSSAETVTITPEEIECGALAITLTPATTDGTNQDYDVEVAVTTKEGRSVKTVKYAAGSKDLDYFETNGTECGSSFTVSSNGVYTVFVQDIDGRLGLKSIVISNIDKDPPAKVTGLTVIYSYSTKKITVSWTNPGNTDFNHVLLSYTKAGNAVVTDTLIEKTKTSYVINDYEADGTTEFVFTVKAVDAVGNVSNEAAYSVTPVAGPVISSIKVDRPHLSGNDADRKVNVTIRGSNFDLITEESPLKVQLVDGDNVSNFTNIIVVDENTRKTEITIPSISSPTETGKNYIIRSKFGDNLPDTEHIATVNVSKDWTCSKIQLNSIKISINDVTDSSTVIATVTGTNLDIAKNGLIKVFDSEGNEYVAGRTNFILPETLHAKSLSVNVKVPDVEDVYTLKVYNGETYRNVSTELQVYGVPQFTKFIIQHAGNAKADGKIKAVIEGKNFKAPSITASNFNASCTKTMIVSTPSFEIIDDKKLLVSLMIPSKADTYDITVTCGEEEITSQMIVEECNGYDVGDVLLKDGTIIDVNNVTSYFDSDEKKANAIGVFAGFTYGGAPIGWIGICSENVYFEGKFRTYDKNLELEGAIFKSVNCYPENNKYRTIISDGLRFEGDVEGIDNWNQICQVDTVNTKITGKYPAYDAVNSYGSTYSLSDDYSSNWFIPSIAELAYIRLNYEKIDSVIQEIKGVSILQNFYVPSSTLSDYFETQFDLWNVWPFDDGTGIKVQGSNCTVGGSAHYLFIHKVN